MFRHNHHFRHSNHSTPVSTVRPARMIVPGVGFVTKELPDVTDRREEYRAQRG